MTLTPSHRALEAIESRDFRHWNGLPDDLQPSELIGDRKDDDLATWRLGEALEPASFALVAKPGYGQLRASIRRGALCLLDASHVELGTTLEELLLALGEPAAKLGWSDELVEEPDAEWVYPDRGITLFLNRSRDALRRIALYRSTTTDEYRDSLRPSFRARLFSST
jgi:hypothetical protein